MNYEELSNLTGKEIAFDLDGTLCEPMKVKWWKHTPGYMKSYYLKVKPIPEMIKLFNLLAEKNMCYIYTARDDLYQNETIAWLKKHKVNYQFVHMKKAFFHVLIDDCVINANDLMTELPKGL